MGRLNTVNPNEATGRVKEILDGPLSQVKDKNIFKAMANSPVGLEAYLGQGARDDRPGPGRGERVRLLHRRPHRHRAGRGPHGRPDGRRPQGRLAGRREARRAAHLRHRGQREKGLRLRPGHQGLQGRGLYRRGGRGSDRQRRDEHVHEHVQPRERDGSGLPEGAGHRVGTAP